MLRNTLGAIRVVSQGIPEGIRFQQIVCGDDHAMALAAKGQVYAWGSGAQGRTGSVAGPDAVDTPTEIKRLYAQHTALLGQVRRQLAHYLTEGVLTEEFALGHTFGPLPTAGTAVTTSPNDRSLPLDSRDPPPPC